MGRLPQLIRRAGATARGHWRGLSFAVLACVSLVVAAGLWIPLPERLLVEDSVVVTWRDGTPAHVFLSPDEKWRMRIRASDVAPGYIEALLAFEDQRFWSHPGVDPLAIARAAMSNTLAGRRVSGASTLTMQVVRLLEPRPRTLTSKLVEAFRAVQLEAHLSKEEILEQYLRLAPFGRNVEGVEAASWAYFGHGASVLTAEEMAVLLAVPQSPTVRYPRPENETRLRAARDRIAARLLEEGLLPRGTGHGALGAQELHAQILETSPPAQMRGFPREVPHVAFWARGQLPYARRIHTSLDAGTQRTVDELVGRYREDAQRNGAKNVAVVVVEHATGEVRAAVGGFSFDASPGAQIAGFDVARSPGSLLKPFIVAAGIDQGLTHPRFLVADTPFRSGTYVPENYDGTFSGLVRMDEALVRSLNIPFVTLLGDIGVENFVGQLRSMGAEHVVTTPGWYGLTAAVGGVEATPLEMAGLYATLARGGRAQPLTLLADADARGAEPGPTPDLPVYSPGATYLVRTALEQRDRPDFTARRMMNPFARRVFWKTGTSFGNKDAWAVGGGPSMTVAVWMGNHDRTSHPSIVGSQRCGALLFDLIDAVEHRAEPSPRPDDLTQVEVCSYSGALPGPACEHTTSVWAPRTRVPTRVCPYHVHADVDVHTGLVVTPECRTDQHVERRSFVQWPAAVRRYLRGRGQAGVERPDYAPGCRPPHHGHAPAIAMPPAGRDIVLMPGVAVTDQQQALEADAADSTMVLNWYVDGAHVGSAPAGDRVWWTPLVGTHDIVVMDELGRSARRVVNVRDPAVP